MTKKEIKRLQYATSRKINVLLHFIMFSLVLITLWGGGNKIYLAHQLAEIEGVSLGDLYGDADIQREYSGVYVTAAKWLTEGIYRTLPVILYITLWALLPLITKQRKQMLELHKEIQANQGIDPTSADAQSVVPEG